ncbi:MAG TPA: sugar phosphate nucleotidyltransferase [Polyangiaceae bacterium]|nr:sugar phosphate nucleotidyltransferase [Polyangiaceae bacterium]
MQAVVLAGGLATRMHPSTLTVPKSMLPVAGRPFVDWQLERLAACGIREVVMCIAFLGDQIEAHVKDGARYGLSVQWSHEGPNLLGTGGALRAALPLLGPAFLVTYGDSYLPFDYAGPLRMLESHDDADGVMSVFKNDGQWDASNVAIDGAWVRRYEKGASDPSLDHIDYGANAFRRSVIAATPEGEAFGLDRVQHDLAQRMRLRAYVAHERFYEVGSPSGLAELDRLLRTSASL